MSSSKIFIESDDELAIKKAKKWGTSNGFEVVVSRKTETEETKDGNSGLELPEGATTVLTHKLANNIINIPSNGENDIVKLHDVTRVALESALKKTNGNIMATSKALGMGRATVYRKIRIYNIDKSFYRREKLSWKKAA